MNRFSELPSASSRDNEYQRALGVAAEEAYHAQQPLLALLRIRQIHDYRVNHRKLKSHFKDKWHAIIHAREPGCAFDHDWHRLAYREAARDLFRRLATDYGLANPHWTAKPPGPTAATASGATDPFDGLMDELSDLDAKVSHPRSSAQAVEQSLRHLRGLEARASRLSASQSPPQQRMLALYPVSIRLAAGNHRGLGVDPFERGMLSHAMLRAALASRGADQDLAIEVSNRLAVRALIRLEFDDAWTQLEALREQFIGHTIWKNDVLGALLGTLGQAYGFLACRDQEASLLNDADAAFVEASTHFEDDDARLRQSVYRLHAAIWRVRLSSELELDDAQAWLTERMAEVQAYAIRDDLGRLDYAVGALLKAHDSLGTQPDAHLRNRIHAQLKVHARDAESAAQSAMAHGLLTAVGWLEVVDGASTPRWATRLRAHMEEVPGTLGMLARSFGVESNRPGDRTGLAYVLGAQRGEEHTRWSQMLKDAGDRPLRRIPFNFV